MEHIQVFSLATKMSGLVCPRCTSAACHKYGRKLGIQRFRCTSCGRTFNETVNTPLHGIHDKQKMQDYLVTMRDQQSIRAASKQLGISVPTSFSWRHRILSSLKESIVSPSSTPVSVCEIQLPHSFKGKRVVSDIQMPETHSLLLSDARGIPCLHLLVNKKKTLEAVLLVANNVQTSTRVTTVKTSMISRVARKIPHMLTQSLSESKSLSTHAVDTMCRLEGWMSRFNGVATKYLQQYWNWYRAEINSVDFEHFRAECFGQRQLQYYRQTLADR